MCTEKSRKTDLVIFLAIMVMGVGRDLRVKARGKLLRGELTCNHLRPKATFDFWIYIFLHFILVDFFLSFPYLLAKRKHKDRCGARQVVQPVSMSAQVNNLSLDNVKSIATCWSSQRILSSTRLNVNCYFLKEFGWGGCSGLSPKWSEWGTCAAMQKLCGNARICNRCCHSNAFHPSSNFALHLFSLGGWH